MGCTQFDIRMIFIVMYPSQINSLVITLYVSSMPQECMRTLDGPLSLCPRDCAFTLGDCSRPPYLPRCGEFTWKERSDAAADPTNNAFRWVVNLRHMTKFKPAR